MSQKAPRFPPILPADYSPEQALAAAALSASPRGEVRGPFVPLLYSPALLDHTQRLGDYLRYRSAIPLALREFAILIAARHWRQRYEWHAHAKLAAQAGVSPAVIEELAQGRTPAGLMPDQRVIYDFCRSVHASGVVPDEEYASARALLGDQGVIDLVGVCGYYAMLAMVLNVAETPVPGNPPDPFLIK